MQKEIKIKLPEELKSYIEEKVKEGFYENDTDVMLAALRFLRREDQREQALVNELKAEFASGSTQTIQESKESK